MIKAGRSVMLRPLLENEATVKCVAQAPTKRVMSVAVEYRRFQLKANQRREPSLSGTPDSVNPGMHGSLPSGGNS